MYIQLNPLDCCGKSSLSPSQRNPQSSIVTQLKQIIRRFVEAAERDVEGLTVHVTLQSAHMWPTEKVIHVCKLQQIVTESFFLFGHDYNCITL